jgi:hypothetical protein
MGRVQKPGMYCNANCISDNVPLSCTKKVFIEEVTGIIFRLYAMPLPTKIHFDPKILV